MIVLSQVEAGGQPSLVNRVVQDFLPIALLIAVACVTSLVRLHLLSVPLERDEGEYAYAGQLMLQGIPPFLEAYNMKMPGIYGIYAVIMLLFGQTIEGIHLGLLFVNLLTIFLLFILGRRLFSSLVGCVAGASFATMSLSPAVLGPFAHAEHFVLLFVLLGAVVLHDGMASGKGYRILLSGFLLGAGFTVLQLGAPFMVFGFLYLLYFETSRERWTWKSLSTRATLFLAGAFGPFVIICAVMMTAGVFPTFWFWTFAYAAEYVSRVGLIDGVWAFNITFSRIIAALWIPWAFALIGLVALLGKRIDKDPKFYCLSFFIFSFLSICPGLYFREHYFVLLLPAIALLAGIGIETALRMMPKRIDAGLSILAVMLLVLVVALSSVFQERKALFTTTPTALSRLIYGFNPFPESIAIAEFIRERTDPTDRIAIVGSEPQIYFYSKRRAATGYLYTYALMENQKFARGMQEQMIQQIESASPRYLVFVNIPTSWLPRPQSERLILSWFNEYQRQYYKVVGVIEIIPGEMTRVRWDQDADGYLPDSSCWLKIFVRL